MKLQSLSKCLRCFTRSKYFFRLISDLVTATPIDYGISIAYRSVMGVEIPKITYHKQPMVCSYNMDRSNSKVDYAYECFYRVKELTVVLAEVENSVYRLANTIRKTQKRANALKNISIPRFEETIKFISESLEEKERKNFQDKSYKIKSIN